MSILVIDIGSSSFRVMLFNAQAEPIPGAQVSRKHQFRSGPDGQSEAEALALCEGIEACMDEIIRHSQAHNIEAIGVASFVGNLLGLDSQMRPVTPIYTYADTRCAEQVSHLQAQNDAEAVHTRTGCRIHSAYHPARLKWLRETDPALFASVRLWTDLASYLFFRWFGEHRCSYSVASWSGLLNRTMLTWDQEWLDELGIGLQNLPALSDYSVPQTQLLDDYAKRWPVLQHIPAYLAVGDGAAANTGAGAIQPGRLALTIGTTAAIRSVTADTTRHVPTSLWAYRINADLHLIGGATSEGGNIYAWVKETMALPQDAEAQVLAQAADAHGLTFLPMLAGERAPGWAAHASGTIHGLSLHSNPVDILQAGLEGIAMRLAHISEQLSESFSGPVFAGGGAIQSSQVWAQILADALNRPLYCLSDPEPTARGVALLTIAALHNRPLDASEPAVSRTIQPRPQHAERLIAARQRQDWLYKQLYAHDV